MGFDRMPRPCEEILTLWFAATVGGEAAITRLSAAKRALIPRCCVYGPS